jgi:MOSC domain-containing protein YiiM
MSDGRVHSVRIHEAEGVMTTADVIEVEADRGLRGDLCAGIANRQVLFADCATLERNKMAPGDLQEQITIDYNALESLKAGSEIAIGVARFVITMPCEPCKTLARRCNAPDPAVFIKEMRGRRGVFANVTAGGSIRAGDAVTVRSAQG